MEGQTRERRRGRGWRGSPTNAPGTVVAAGREGGTREGVQPGAETTTPHYSMYPHRGQARL